MNHKWRIAVVSPFLDRKHGTERCIIEQIERLSGDYEIHVYSGRVEDLEPSKFIWHRIPSFPSPHLIAYIWFSLTNQIVRWWDRRINGLTFDLVFSPGINCLDADLMAVHMVFAEFYRIARPDIQLSRNPLISWPRLIHRILLYRLFIVLESCFYRNKEICLTAVSKKVANDLSDFIRATMSPCCTAGSIQAISAPKLDCLYANRRGKNLELRKVPSCFCLLAMIGKRKDFPAP